MDHQFINQYMTAQDFGLSRMEDLPMLSRTEREYFIQQKKWEVEGVPLRCQCRSVATDIFYNKGGTSPVIFYCRWCKSLWHTPSALSDRILEVNMMFPHAKKAK